MIRRTVNSNALFSVLMLSLTASSDLGKRVFHRIHGVKGFNDNRNDIIFSGFTGRSPLSNVIFFGGDIQDYEENMKDSEFPKWSLDFTAKTLADKFPFSFIWIIKPSEMQNGTYSIYRNFVKSGNYGIPKHHTNQNSWIHLHLLLKNAVQKITDENLLDHNICYDYSSIMHLPLVLIGFSKGCNVLNQLLYDLTDVNNCNEVQQTINRVNGIYWLDGGHAGSSQTWVTSTKILQDLVSRNIKIEIHVTPFQINNKYKPIVGKEYKIFLQHLKDLKADVSEKVHFADQPPSIENHFSVLLLFK